MKARTEGSHVAFPSKTETSLKGMTKREYFAAMALAGTISVTPMAHQHAARNAVIAADWLISELNSSGVDEVT